MYESRVARPNNREPELLVTRGTDDLEVAVRVNSLSMLTVGRQFKRCFQIPLIVTLTHS
jgi:hypothetical protein